jgi:hypothetical protein
MSDATATDVPTTEVPTTEVPTTEVPTTEVPTTEVPTTEVPTTEVPTTEVPTTEPVYLFDVNTLVTEHDRLLQKEAEDRALANTVEFPDMTAFKAKLVEWAGKGFPPAYAVLSFTLNPPAVCSDGVSRDPIEYFVFLTGATLLEKAQAFSAKLKGMHVEHEAYHESTEILIRVFRD